MVTAALRSVFAQENAADILSRWDDLAVSLAERFPKAAELMNEAREEVLAFRHFPAQHWKKVWSTNLLERVNKEIKRRTRVVGIFPNDAAITRLVGAVLMEQDEHWQLEGRRMFSAESMAAIPELEDLPALRPPSRNWRIFRPCSAQPPERCNTQAPGDRGRCAPTGRSGLDHRPGAGAVAPSQYRPLPLRTQLQSDGRLDKSIVLFHRGKMWCISTSGMTARHSTLFTL